LKGHTAHQGAVFARMLLGATEHATAATELQQSAKSSEHATAATELI
jgi:hypothetical protein